MLNLAADEKRPFEFSGKVFDDVAGMIYKAGGFKVEQMTDPKARKMVEETLRVLSLAVDTAVPHEVPETLRYALEGNGFIFSGLKAFHQMREIGLSMLDEKGNVKPFEAFKEDVKKVNDHYNTNYLYAEYKHALGSSLMAVKWEDLAKNPDRYFLQYRTAGDSKVREEHRRLDGVTLPATDPFWDKYYPPNGWGCRCQVTKVRRSKYQATDPKQAMKDGDEMTEDIKQRIFRYNAGKEMNLFPPKHPYYKAPEKAAQAVQGFVPQPFEAKTVAEAEEEFRKKLGVNCSLKGFRKKDLYQVEDIFKCVDRHFQQFPELREKIRFVGSISGRVEMLADAMIKEAEKNLGAALPPTWVKEYKKRARRYAGGAGCYAYSHAAFEEYDLNGVAFNTSWAGEKIETSLKSDVANKWHPLYCDTVKAVFDHELGHKVDELLKLRDDPEFRKIFDECKDKGAEYIQDNLSRYAFNPRNGRFVRSGYNAYAEFIAEAWSEYTNNPQPRPIATAVAELIRQKYAKLKK